MKPHDVCDKAGITYRQIDYWLSTGILKARDRNNPGTGHYRDLPDTEVEIACRIGVLLRLGFTLKWAAMIARYLVTNDVDTCGLRFDGKRRIAIRWVPDEPEAEEGAA